MAKNKGKGSTKSKAKNTGAKAQNNPAISENRKQLIMKCEAVGAKFKPSDSDKMIEAIIRGREAELKLGKGMKTAKPSEEEPVILDPKAMFQDIEKGKKPKQRTLKAKPDIQQQQKAVEQVTQVMTKVSPLRDRPSVSLSLQQIGNEIYRTATQLSPTPTAQGLLQILKLSYPDTEIKLLRVNERQIAFSISDGKDEFRVPREGDSFRVEL